MSRRNLLALALLTASIVLVGLLPGHPAVREPLLERLLALTDEAGIRLDYERSSGNLWRGITLTGVTVRGEGIDMDADSVRVGWFLPPLITGELPLRVRVGTLEGNLDVARFVAALPPPAEPSGAGLPLPRLRWQEVTLDGADVRIADVPFTLPDLRLEGLAVTGDDSALSLVARLVTSEGAAEVVGRADVDRARVELDLLAGDARVARQWWDGIQAGVVRGQVIIDQDGVTAEGWVEDGEIEAFGAEVVDIAGPVRWDGARVHADVQGRAVGGAVTASGVVDVAARRWEVTGRADADMAELTPLLWALGATGEPLAVSGRARADVSVAGWTDVALHVDGVVDARVLGFEAETFATQVSYADGSLRVRGDGRFGSGQLAFALLSQAGVVDIAADLENAVWGPIHIDDVSGRLRLGAEPDGAARLRGTVPAADGLPVVADLTLDADGASLFVDAGLVDGLRLRGAAVAARLTGDADLQGSLRLLLPEQLWEGPAPDVTLTLAGVLARPEAELVVSGDAAAVLRLDGWRSPLDLRGRLRAELTEGGVELTGALGDVSVRGGLGGGRSLDVDIPALDVRGPVDLAFPALALQLSVDEGGGVTLREERLTIGLAEGGWQGVVAGLEVVVAGLPVTLDGRVERPPDGAWRGSAELVAGPSDDALAASRASLVLDPDGTLRADARIPPGTALGPLQPALELVASATFDVPSATGRARLDAGPLSVDADWRGDALAARLGDADEALDLAWSAAGWSLDGSLALRSLTPLLGLDETWQGRLTSDLRAGPGAGAVGEARLTLDAPLQVSGVVRGDGETLTGSLRSDIADQALELAGTLLPELALVAHLGPLGPIHVDATGGAGAGSLPALDLGPLTLPHSDWHATIDPTTSTANLTLGSNTLTLTWHDQPHATLTLDQPITTPTNEPLTLTGHASWHPTTPDGTLDLTLTTTNHTLLTLTGNLRHATLHSHTPTTTLTNLLTHTLHPPGTLTTTATINTLDTTAHLTTTWTLPDTTVEASLSVGEGPWHLSLSEGSGRNHLSGDLTLTTTDTDTPTLHAQLTGTVADHPTSLSLTGTTTNASLRTTWRDASLDASWRDDHLRTTLHIPDFLTTTLAGPTTPLHLDGDATVAGLRLPLALRGPDATGAPWRLLLDDTLALAFDGDALALSGRAGFGLGQAQVTLASALGWSPADGFSGDATIGLDGLPAEARVAAALAGRGGLDVTLTAWRGDVAAGGATGRVEPDPRDGWQLELDLDVPLAGQGLDAWRLALTGRASGAAAAPRADVSLALLGPVAAHGRLWFDAGTLRADLVGSGINASARWDDAGGRAQLRLVEADVSAWLPWLATPRLSVGLDGHIGPDGPEVVANDLRLQLERGAISGRGRLDGDGVVEALLRSDLALADVLVTPALSGRLSGPFTLRTDLDRPWSESELAGVLVLGEGRLDGVAGRFDGDVQVTGPAADPTISLLVRASDGAEGSLRANLRPRDATGEIDADLHAGDVRLDLRGRLDPTGLRADGRVALGDTLSLSVRSEGSGIVVAREDDPQALQAQLTPDPWRLSLHADLARVAPGLAGIVTAEFDWPDGLWPDLDGRLEGLSLGTLETGDWQLQGDGGQRASWWARSAFGDLRLGLPDLTWQARLEELPLDLGADTARLALEVNGQAAAGSLSAALHGDVDGRPVTLALDGQIDLSAGTGRLAASGTILDGHLDGTIERSATGSWLGGVRLAEARLAGRPLALDLGVVGSGWLPRLEADAHLGDDVAVALRYDPASHDLQATVDVPALASLTLDGHVWPELDLAVGGVAPDAAGLVRLRGSWNDPARPLRAHGDLRIDLGALGLGVQGSETGRVRLRATSPLVADGWLEQTLPMATLAATLDQLVTDGLALEGRGTVRGALALTPGADGLTVEARALSTTVAGVGLRVDARAEGFADVEGQVQADLSGLDAARPWLPAGLGLQAPIEAQVRLLDERLHVELAAPWSVTLEADLAAGSGRLASDIGWLGPSGPSGVQGELRLDPERGLQGRLTLAGIGFAAATRAPLSLDGHVAGIGGGVAADVTLRGPRSAVTARGQTPVPAALARTLPAGEASVRRELDLRVAALDLRDLPALRDAVPYLDGVVSGSLAVRDDQAVGQLVAGDLRLAERALPLVVTIAADLATPSADVRVEAVGSSATLTWRDGRVDALARLERFPLHALVEALIGPSDVSAEVTGAVRAGWQPGDTMPDLRVATELVRLERGGVVTRGQVAFDLSDGALRIQEAAFEGHGEWSASGEIRPERIDLEVVAEAADFGPLLGLVPALARYAVSAAGDLRLVGSGTLAHPILALEGRQLRVDVAGTSYELRQGDVRLDGQDLHLQAEVLGLSPLEGSVTLAGSGRLQLSPFDVADLLVTAQGDLDVPLVGRLSDLDARLTRSGGGATSLLVDGTMGAPFRIDGSLDPFDLRAVGRGVELAVPFLFVGSSTLDADLRARLDEGLLLSGTIAASQLRIDLGARAAAGLGVAEQPSPAERAAQRAALELVVFDRLRLLAPQRVTLAETFGSAEAGFDLTLSGDAADPRLEGEAAALRGTFRFSGRDFEISRAEASFEPTRGVLPRVTVEARSQFEKARAIAPGSAVSFVAPAGPRFEVTLAFDADVVANVDGELGLDLVPRLASDALIEVPVAANGISAGTRALTELELLGLIAFGRLEPGGVSGAFAGAVAQSALDTAVDLLVVSELQAALSEALGIDVVEIRTSALTDLLAGGADPFGVSLRFGGYLSDELFASYRVGTFDDAERAFAFTQELVLTYDVGPVAFDLSGRLDFPSAAAAQPVPGVSAAVRYDLSRSVALEAGVDLQTERQTARLGVTWRW